MCFFLFFFQKKLVIQKFTLYLHIYTTNLINYIYYEQNRAYQCYC